MLNIYLRSLKKTDKMLTYMLQNPPLYIYAAKVKSYVKAACHATLINLIRKMYVRKNNRCEIFFAFLAVTNEILFNIDKS